MLDAVLEISFMKKNIGLVLSIFDQQKLRAIKPSKILDSKQ